MMSKTISSATAFALMLLALAGCGGSGASASNSSIGSAQPVQQAGFIYGVKIEGDDFPHPDRIEAYFQAASDLGMSTVKVLVPQDLVEPVNGQWTWKVTMGPGTGVDYDQIAAYAQQYGISVVPMFESPRDAAKQADPAGFADFVSAFVDRYKSSMNIRFTEFQNEPNTLNDGTGSTDSLAIWKYTAAELVAVDNAAYDRLKAKYPDIKVGSAGFITGSRLFVAAYTQKFYDAYFPAGPRFDFFALHDYPKNYSYAQGTQPGDLVSEYHLFDTYRSLLAQHGYSGTPILVTEGFVDSPFQVNGVNSWTWPTDGEAATLWAEGFLRTSAASGADNVMGKIITGVRTTGTMGLIDSSDSSKRNHYYFVKHLLSLLKLYPSPVSTQEVLNSDACWVATFQNSAGKKLWVLLNPVLYQTTDVLEMPALLSKSQRFPQTIILPAGTTSQVRISSVVNGTVSTAIQAVVNGSVTISVTDNPVFVEEL